MQIQSIRTGSMEAILLCTLSLYTLSIHLRDYCCAIFTLMIHSIQYVITIADERHIQNFAPPH